MENRKPLWRKKINVKLHGNYMFNRQLIAFNGEQKTFVEKEN